LKCQNSVKEKDKNRNLLTVRTKRKYNYLIFIKKSPN
jgi:hypothetical protein